VLFLVDLVKKIYTNFGWIRWKFAPFASNSPGTSRARRSWLSTVIAAE